jgi:hypothetical protein
LPSTPEGRLNKFGGHPASTLPELGCDEPSCDDLAALGAPSCFDMVLGETKGYKIKW